MFGFIVNQEIDGKRKGEIVDKELVDNVDNK